MSNSGNTCERDGASSTGVESMFNPMLFKEQVSAPEPHNPFTRNGQTHRMTPSECQAFTQGLIRERGLGIGLKAVSAQDLWDGFHKINDDQCFVSWCIELTRGVERHPRAIINHALSAQQIVDQAIASGDPNAVVAVIQNAHGRQQPLQRDARLPGEPDRRQ